MSFHSMRDLKQPRLRIHPYTYTRPFEQMPEKCAAMYREWSRAMNKNSNYYGRAYYRTGTTAEAIHCTAKQSSIDWMEESRGIYAFVVEAVPPYDGQWCDNTKEVLREAHRNAMTANRFIQFALHGRVIHNYSISLGPGFPLVLLFVGIVFLARRRVHNWGCSGSLNLLLRRLGKGKVKVVVAEAELQALDARTS